MLRLSRARVITDIETIVNKAASMRGQHVWTAKGAECSLDRHSFAGVGYGFQTEILRLRLPAAKSVAWELLLVSEYWRRGDGEPIHTTKWLKLIAGKSNDVLKWVAANRD